MPRWVKFAFSPRWLALHILVAAASVTMVLLGRWQWHVAHVHHGSVQNYAYAFQWWAFTVFLLFMWVRVLRDQARKDRGAPIERQPKPATETIAPVEYRRYVMPSTRDATPVEDDPELAAYNAYLADLADQAAEQTRKDDR